MIAVKFFIVWNLPCFQLLVLIFLSDDVKFQGGVSGSNDRVSSTGRSREVSALDFGGQAPMHLDVPSTPSPRRFRIPPGARERFLLQDSENYFNMLSVSEHETTFDAESAAETNSPLMTSRTGATTDRATSPSMASVTSGHSAASSVGGVGGVRRLLEWDSGADLVRFFFRRLD